MTKAVFTTKVDPTYNDRPDQHYHFPRTYLRQAQAAVGDWIVYYEPRRTTGDLASRGGRQAYFATARVNRLEADPAASGHFYAFVSDYIEFDRPVPFREGQLTYERALAKDDGSTNKGAFGRSVRNLSDSEYDLILQAGFTRTLGSLARERAWHNEQLAAGFAENESETIERPIVERLLARPFRDAAFAMAVKAAYGETCAMTGLRIINGGGRAEVQAAHIRPVAHKGPDSVRNGLALSGTLHWLFDRGLIAVDEDYSLLLAQDRVPDTIGRLLNPDRRLRLPLRTELRPHLPFLNYHRTTIFKG